MSTSTEEAEAKYKKRDDASARLAEKMLQGWTMLGVNCPSDDCFTPLMRSKQGKMYCVNCCQFVMTEEEAREERERQQQLADEQATQQAKEDAKKKAAEPTPVQQQQQAAPSASAQIKRKNESAPVDDEELRLVRRQTLSVLYQKVEVLTNSMSTTDHTERLSSVAKTIRELAEAIKILSE